jgi:hypothetical protein
VSILPDPRVDRNHQEKRRAKRDGATQVRNSGRGFRKGDAVWRGYLVDYKHNAKSFSLNLKAWSKHAKDAWNEEHKIPMIKVIFEDDTQLAIVPWDVIVELESYREVE